MGYFLIEKAGQLFVNIIEPNAEVRPEFVSNAVETKDDEILLGLVANETGTSVTLCQAYGTVTVLPRASITAIPVYTVLRPWRERQRA